MPAVEIPVLGDIALAMVATDWVANKLYSDKHIPEPLRRKDIICAVFPTIAQLLQIPAANKLLSEASGLYFEFYELRSCDAVVRVPPLMPILPRPTVLPVFDSVKIMHKDNLPGFQRAIEAERTRLKSAARSNLLHPN